MASIYMSVHLGGALMLPRTQAETRQKAPGRGPSQVSGYFDPEFPLVEHSKRVLPRTGLKRLNAPSETLVRYQVSLGRGELKELEQFSPWKPSQVHQYADVC